MSTSPLPVPFLVSNPSAPSNLLTMPTGKLERSALIRRRPNRQQGEALERLGHALEYLVDTRMFVYKERNTKGDAEAIHILSRCSREVFASCAEVVPMKQRVKNWLRARLHVGELSLGQASPH